MLDGKILIAVLISLTAISAGLDGSSLDSVDREGLKENAKDLNSGGFNFNFGSMLSNPVSEVKNIFTNKPEPTNEVEAVLEVKELSDEDINLQKADLEAENFTSLDMGSQTVNSDTRIKLYGFTGTVRPGTVTEISGGSEGFLSSGVNVSGLISVDERIASDSLRFTDIEKSALAFSSVTGEITSSNTSIEFGSERSFEINSFSGNLTIEPEQNRLTIKGKVDSLEAGDFGYGN